MRRSESNSRASVRSSGEQGMNEARCGAEALVEPGGALIASRATDEMRGRNVRSPIEFPSDSTLYCPHASEQPNPQHQASADSEAMGDKRGR